MSWDLIIPRGVSISPLELVGLIVAALAGLVVLIVSVRRRRARTEPGVEAESVEEVAAPEESEQEPLVSLDDDDFLKRAFPAHSEDSGLDEIPPFTSLPVTGEREDRGGSAEVSSSNAGAGDVSSLLFRLLGTKARILELERAERTKSQVLSATREALENLKDFLEGSSSELQDEIDEMHELISGELSASHESSASVQQLKEIIEAQYDLLNKPGAVYSADLLMAKQSYVETIDASLDRRLKNAERRETEFALGKERIMELKKQMLRLKDSEMDSTRAH